MTYSKCQKIKTANQSYKDLPNRQKLWEFITTRSALQEMLKVLQAELKDANQ